jgi:hypothetical protein
MNSLFSTIIFLIAMTVFLVMSLLNKSFDGLKYSFLFVGTAYLYMESLKMMERGEF